MADGASFELLLQLTQGILGCQIVTSDTSASASMAENLSQAAALVATSTCAAPAVNYCGPGNSGNPGNPFRNFLPTVAPCLNEACCNHDNCYADVCESLPCYFTSNRACDNPLLATCLGFGSCSRQDILGSLPTQFVCTVITCLLLPAPGTICEDIQRPRVANPACQQPCTASSCCPQGTTCSTSATVVAGARNGVCCPPNQTACGSSSTCCPSGQCCGSVCCSSSQTCSNRTCVTTCSSGETLCGTQCCPAGQICSNGQCMTSCPLGTLLCGTSCCSSGQTCSNGSCVPTTCSSGGIPCGPGGGCCYDGHVCCENPLGQFGCGFIGGICCSNGITAISCPANNGCCFSGDAAWCCPPPTTGCGAGLGVCV
jgi:hypothetical protein